MRKKGESVGKRLGLRRPEGGREGERDGWREREKQTGERHSGAGRDPELARVETQVMNRLKKDMERDFYSET